MAKEIAYRETAARMAAETIAAQQAEIRRLESENARLRAAAEKVSDWHQHATGCPVSEMDAPSDAECDCGLGAIRAALSAHEAPPVWRYMDRRDRPDTYR